jgi:type I restriction enzyme S subunit
MAQRIYKEWFVDFKYPGHENDELVDSELGMIPEGWVQKEANDLFEINIGKTPPRKEPQWFNKENLGVKWISIKDMGASNCYVLQTNENITNDGIDRFNVKVVPKNTVIMSFKLTVGKVAITTENMATNEAIAHFNIRDHDLIFVEFIFCYLQNFNFQLLGNTSSIGNAINSQIVKSMPILLPKSDVVRKFQKYVVPTFKQILLLIKKNNTLRQTRDLLLPKLISGKVDVSDLDIEIGET